MSAMPIDFARVAARYRGPLAEAGRRAGAAVLGMGALIEARAAQAEARARSAEHLPRLDYRGGALVVRVAGGPLSPGLGGRLLENLSYPVTAVRQERLFYGVITDLAEVAEAAAASSRRYARPWPGMFDPGTPRSPGDVFGQLLLLVESVVQSRAAVISALRGVLALRREVSAALGRAGEAFAAAFAAVHPPKPAPAGPSPPGSAAAGPATVVTPAPPVERSTADMLREVNDLLPGLVAGLPAIGPALDVLGPGVDRLIREALLERLASLERKAIGLRLQVLGLIRDAVRPGARVAQWITDMGLAVGTNVVFILDALASSAMNLIDSLRTGFVSLMGKLGAVGSARTAIEDLERTEIPKIGKSYGEFMDDVVRGDSNWLTAVQAFLRVLAHPPSPDGMPVPPPPGAERLDALADAVGTLNTATPDMVGADVPPVPTASFPDFGEHLFGDKARNARLLGAAGVFGTQVQATVADVFGGVATMLETTAAAAKQAGEGAGWLGSPKVYARIARDAHAHAGHAFDEMREHARGRIRDEDGVALAIGDQMISGAGAVASVAIPAYVGAVRDRLRRGEHRPTSAHILARRERVTRVRVPRVVLRATGETDEALAQRVAEEFRGAMRTAYRTGIAQQGVATP